jgi:hypothetical protein
LERYASDDRSHPRAANRKMAIEKLKINNTAQK